LTWTNETLPPESYGNPFNNVKFFAEERAIGVTLNCIYLYTGRTVLQPPGVQYSRKSGELWEYNIYWKRIIGTDKFKLQIAESIPHWSGGRFSSIPDFEEKLIIDTTGFLDTIINLKTKFYMDYYIRVKAYNDSLESEWSPFESFTTLKDTGNYPPLDACWPIWPMDGSHLKRNNIRFVWTRIKNAEKYSLYIATELNYKIGGLNYAIYDIMDTTYLLASELQSETKYYWWIIAQASKWADSQKVLAYFYTTKVTDVSESSFSDNRLLYPNPSTEYIYINLGSENFQSQQDIRIYNTLGHCMMTIEANSRSPLQRIDISRLPYGMYYLKTGDSMNKFMVLR